MYCNIGYIRQYKLAMFVAAKYLTTLKPFSLLTFSDVCVCICACSAATSSKYFHIKN